VVLCPLCCLLYQNQLLVHYHYATDSVFPLLARVCGMNGKEEHSDEMKTTRSVALSRQRHSVIIIILLGFMGVMISFTQLSYAFPIFTDRQDMKISWNNSVRYNWGMRMQERDPRIANNAAYDQGDALFDRYDTITNRLDWLRQRAEALRASNDALELFNRAATGRELRMIELKQEINELCRRLGEPPRHAMDQIELKGQDNG